MCGIFGYVGKGGNAGELVLAGLKKLEYRGYDSWGIASFNGRKLEVVKKVGKIGQARSTFSPSRLALGQTRWATHGGVTVANAHPHFDCQRRLALVHNGIVENFQELKKKLKGHHRFTSQTDTEVIVHLIEDRMQKGEGFLAAVRSSFLKLEGLNAMVVLDVSTGQVAAVKNGSPLVVGLSRGENFVASDCLGIAEHTHRVIFLEDRDLVLISSDRVQSFDARTGQAKKVRRQKINWKIEEESLGKFKHFLIKEIYEQPRVIKRISRDLSAEVAYLARLIKQSFGTFLVGCGTASYAGLAGTYFFNTLARRHLNFAVGSEFNYLEDFITPQSLVIGVSQSGETVDIIESLTKAKKKGAKIAAIVNVVGSTLYRLSDYNVLVGAGQERAVISTKAFIGQVSLLLFTAYALANKAAEGRVVLEKARRSLSDVLGDESQRQIKRLASRLWRNAHLYILGRGISYPAALESALKIKESSYIHAEGFAAGELKHGVIALIERGTPCLVLAPPDETYGATLASAMEVKARGGYVIGLSDKNNEVFDDFIKVPFCGPASILPNVAVAQTLSYYLTLRRGNDPDKPRNLAKSVTVK